MVYATGYVRNPQRRTPKTYAALATHEAATGASLRKFTCPMLDQGPSGACTGHARAKGIYTARAAAGAPLNFIPSPDDLYRNTRCFARGDWAAPLTDDGADPVDTIDAAAAIGVRPMVPLATRFSDVDPATVNREPRIEDLVIDGNFKFLDDHQILAEGADRIALFQDAIRQGYPVCLDVPGGGEQWQRYGSSAPAVLVSDGTPLDHYVCALGYYYDVAGNLVIEGDNSWGTGWGFDGKFYAAASVLLAARDVIVCVERLP